MQSLIRHDLVRPEAFNMAPWVVIRCVHGDVHRYLIVSVEIHYNRQRHSIKAAVSAHLSHPLILGTDWEGFHQVATTKPMMVFEEAESEKYLRDCHCHVAEIKLCYVERLDLSINKPSYKNSGTPLLYSGTG